MRAWTAENALSWAKRSPARSGHAFVWSWRGKIVASDGHLLVMQSGAGVAHPPDTIEWRRLLGGLARAKLLRPIRLTDRFRAWLSKRAHEKADDNGNVVVSICDRRFNARLVAHAVGRAPDHARVAMQRGGRLEPLHIVAPGFRAVVMPMYDPPLTLKRRRWP